METRHARPDNALAAALLVLLTVACVGGQFFRGEPHGWWAERGPVVPHATFPARCDLCHTGDDWVTLRADFEFDHLAETGVELRGAHARAECLRCHNDRGPVQQFAARGCAGCHEDVHEGLRGDECATCHGETQWRVTGAIAAHERTRFPLVGAHAATACRRCHEGIEAGIMAPLDVECISCHQADLARATSPDHLGNGWVESCDRCHIPTAWSGAAFNHATFPLVGAHRSADCAECHIGGVFAGTPRDCVGCHLADYQNTSDPNHVAAGFSQDCAECHDTFDWDNARFAHTGYPLTGAHTMADCASCHAGNVFAGTPSACVDCHLADFQGADDPDHVAAGFSTDCAECHTTFGWSGASFDHSSFPLTGAHTMATCDQCHVGGVFSGTPSDCFDCHQADYQGATDPDHVGAGFPTDCTQCHSTFGWSGAAFDHAGFPLTGAHLSATCNDCHPGMVYVGTPNECVDCHLAEYQGATDPDHVDAGFPQTCESCHGTATWSGATFDHRFPIQGGDHGGLSCAECHQVPGNYAQISCTHCHAHRQSEMADKHDDVGGYVWSSPACINCHPDGRDD